MMKADALRKLIGQEIQWEYAHDRNRGTYLMAKAVVKEVKGKNVLVDECGMIGWKWLPDMINLKAVEPQ